MVYCDERIKRKVVQWKKEGGAEGKDFIMIVYCEVPSWEVLGSLQVNMTPRCEGYCEGYSRNTDQIRWQSDYSIAVTHT